MLFLLQCESAEEGGAEGWRYDHAAVDEKGEEQHACCSARPLARPGWLSIQHRW